MNFVKVIIENVFGSLKNQYRFLKYFNSSVNKVHAITI